MGNAGSWRHVGVQIRSTTLFALLLLGLATVLHGEVSFVERHPILFDQHAVCVRSSRRGGHRLTLLPRSLLASVGISTGTGIRVQRLLQDLAG